MLDYQDVSPPKPAKEAKNIFSKILSAISAVVQNLYTKQADFHKNVKISKVSVKTPWLKKYKIHYRADSDSAWQAYQEQLGVDKVCSFFFIKRYDDAFKKRIEYTSYYNLNIFYIIMYCSLVW